MNLNLFEEGLQVHEIPINEIKFNADNPRVILGSDFDKLVQSVKEDGFMLTIRFLVIDKHNVVMGGNQRLKACQKAGLTHVYCVKAEDLTAQQLKEFVIRDNVHAGEFDKELVTIQYEKNELLNLGVDLINFDQPVFETIGDTNPEVDPPDLQQRKEVFDNNPIKQVVVYFPADLHDKVLESIAIIKEHLQVQENSELLLKLISYWKQENVAS